MIHKKRENDVSLLDMNIFQIIKSAISSFCVAEEKSQGTVQGT